MRVSSWPTASAFIALALAALLASCTTDSDIAEQRADRPAAATEIANANTNPVPEASAVPEDDSPTDTEPTDTAPTDTEPTDTERPAGSEPVVYATSEDVFALDPVDGSAVLLGRRDEQPAIRPFSADYAANGSLYWIIVATTEGFGRLNPVDGSVVIRTDLRTGASERFIELGEIETGKERSHYDLIFVSATELIVRFADAGGTSDADFAYHRFDSVTGAALSTFAASVFDPIACTTGVDSLLPLPDGKVLAQSPGATGVFDPATAALEPLVACDNWPTFGDHLDDLDLMASVQDAPSYPNIDIEDIAAQGLSPHGLVPIVAAQGDYWWLAAASVRTPNDATALAVLSALVRFDPETQSVVQVWPLGDLRAESFPAETTVLGLQVVHGQVALELMIATEFGHLAVLDARNGEWTLVSVESVPRLSTTSVTIQQGTSHLLISRERIVSGLRHQELSFVTIDQDTLTLGHEIPVVDLAPIAVQPAPDVPAIDPRRIWPSIRDLGPHETLLRVPSEAMAPTVTYGDAIIVSTAPEPTAGDLIVFAKPQGDDRDKDLLKRIVAVGGQTVAFADGVVYSDGAPIDEPYLQEPNSTRPRLLIPGCVGEPSNDRCELPPDTFFMLGDNRLGSSDSRVYGPIPADSVVGVVVEIVPGGGE